MNPGSAPSSSQKIRPYFFDQGLEPRNNLRCFLQLTQGRKLAINIAEIKMLPLADEDLLHIDPILITCGKCLENDKVFG